MSNLQLFASGDRKQGKPADSRSFVSCCVRRFQGAGGCSFFAPREPLNEKTSESTGLLARHHVKLSALRNFAVIAGATHRMR
jgi:hypothetical protein